MSFTFAVIALSARIACLDGPLTPEKYVAFRESFPLQGGICGKIRSLFALACEDQTPFEHYVSQIRHVVPLRSPVLSALVDRLFRIASADGMISRESEHMLAKVAHLLEITPADFAALHNRHLRPQAA